jgi:TolA-binding protein
MQLGRIHLEAGDSRRALSAFEAAQTSSDDSQQQSEAVYGQAMALVDLGQTGDAELMLRDLVEAAPDDPAVLPAVLGLGRISEGRGRTGQAASFYRQVATGSRGEAGAEALFRLGMLLRSSGDVRGALAEYSRMPTLFAGYAEWMARGYLEQARAFRDLGETGEAARLYETLVDLYPDRPEAVTAREEWASIQNNEDGQ